MGMSKIISNTSSVLGLTIGSVNTRAVLFDIVEGGYRIIATGEAGSTIYAPDRDAQKAIVEAVKTLEDTTGAKLLDPEGNLLVGASKEGEGVGKLVLTTSCGLPLRVITLGLLDDMSLASVNRLATSMTGKVMDSIGINDRRKAHVQMDEMLNAKPDLLLFGGGTEDGASRSVMQMTRLISFMLQVTPRQRRPAVFYCGNSKLSKKIKNTLDRYTKVRVSANIRPDIDTERLEPAQADLGEMLVELEASRIGGLKEIRRDCSVPPIPSNLGFSRVIRFLGNKYDPLKGALGVDLGASSSFACYSNQSKSSAVKVPYGTGAGVEQLLRDSSILEITQWLDGSQSEGQVQDALWQQSLFPASVPLSNHDLEVELALVRQVLRRLMAELLQQPNVPSSRFEPILVSSSILNRVPDPRKALLAILDGIQPLGVTPVILDRHAIAPMLGAAAGLNPVLAAQVLETSAFTHLATVINAACKCRSGTPVLSARLEVSNGMTPAVKVKQGTIVALPLKYGEQAKLHLRKLRRLEIEDVDVTHAPINVTGGACGVVIDARGRPLDLPENVFQRRELLKSWQFSE